MSEAEDAITAESYRSLRAERTWRVLKITVLYVPLAAFISLVFVPWFRENIAP